MAGNRKAAEKVIVDNIEALLPGSENTKIYEEMFKAMSDKEFDAFISGIESGEEDLSIVVPNMGDVRLDIDRNLALAKKLGHSFFEKIWITNPSTGYRYLSPKRYMLVDLPLRRQAQLLRQKISIPKDNRSIDNLTGQPTSDSKGAKISYPEMQIMASAGLDNCIVELMKYRGGDLRGFNAMNASISNTGGVSIEALDKLGTKVKSTTTLRTILTGMHIKSTL